MTEFYTDCFTRSNKIYLRGYKNGKRFKQIIDDYQPYIFLKDSQGDYQTVYGEAVKKHVFKNMKAARETVKNYNDVGLDYYGLTRWEYPFLNDMYPGLVKFDESLIKIVSIDIEVDSRNGFPNLEKADSEVTAITLAQRDAGVVRSITFGIKDFVVAPADQLTKTYIQSPDESNLLEDFISYWGTEEWNPDIITGWSSDMFDIPYMIRRIRRVLGDPYVKKLSPYGIEPEPREIIRSKGSSNSFDQRKDIVYDIPGMTMLDYLQLYKKLTFTNHPSYSLKNISMAELGDTKIDYDEYDGLDDLYAKNPQKFYTYNIKDAVLPLRLDDKKNFLSYTINIAYRAKVNFLDAMVTLRPWDVIIHNYLLERKIVIPQYRPKATRDFMGGYVKDPIPGLYRYVVALDFDALYPKIISQHNISPETFVRKIPASSPEHIVKLNRFPTDNDGDGVVCANGCIYRRDKRGFIPEIVEIFINERKLVKDKMLVLSKEDKVKHKKVIDQLDSAQNGVKILNNGLYGGSSNPYFRWFDIDNAEAVTSTAQTCTRWVEKGLNEYFNKAFGTVDENYIIACDTDSVYINLEPLVKFMKMDNEPTEKIIKFMDRVHKEKINPVVKKLCDEICEKFRVYKPQLNMKRETLCDKAIWRSGKMYMMNVWDKEGTTYYDDPKIIMKGIEAVRSSTPPVCRDNIKKAVKIILQKDENALQDFVAQFKEEWLKLQFYDMAFPRTANDVTEYSNADGTPKKGTPVHIKAALVYNATLKALDLTKKYQPIRNKDKVRWIYLRTPNPFHSPIIAAPDDIPVEFELDEWIDKELQFDKAFLKPIESITDAIGWCATPRATLEELM